MRLQTAMSINEFEGMDDEFNGMEGEFEGRAERQARRKARRARWKANRKRRRGRRKERRSGRLRERADRLHPRASSSSERGGTSTPPRRPRPGGMRRGPGGGMRRGSGGGMRRGPGRKEQSLEPAPSHMEEFVEHPPADEFFEPEPPFAPEHYPEDYPDWIEDDAEWSSRPRRRRRPPRAELGAVVPRWGPLVKLGPQMRIQASSGYRAAVVPLKPGLFIVAEIPEQMARSEFGVAPLLVPLVTSAASRAINRPPEQRLIPRLLQRRDAQGQPRTPLIQRLFPNRQQRVYRHPVPAQQQAQLVPMQQQTQLVPVSHVQRAPLSRWVDDDDLDELAGCLCPDEQRR